MLGMAPDPRLTPAIQALDAERKQRITAEWRLQPAKLAFARVLGAQSLKAAKQREAAAKAQAQAATA